MHLAPVIPDPFPSGVPDHLFTGVDTNTQAAQLGSYLASYAGRLALSLLYHLFGIPLGFFLGLVLLEWAGRRVGIRGAGGTVTGTGDGAVSPPPAGFDASKYFRRKG